jgi:hypothetical protein
MQMLHVYRFSAKMPAGVTTAMRHFTWLIISWDPDGCFIAPAEHPTQRDVSDKVPKAIASVLLVAMVIRSGWLRQTGQTTDMKYPNDRRGLR